MSEAELSRHSQMIKLEAIKKMDNKVLNTIIGVALGLIVLGFIIGTGVLVLSEFNSGLTASSDTNENQTQTGACSSNVLTLEDNFADFISDYVMTTTNGTIILSNASEVDEVPNNGNWTAYSNGTIVFHADSEWAACAASSINASYTYQVPSAEQAVISNFTESTGNVSDQMPVYGTVVGVMAILILIVGIVYFARGRMGR